MPNPSWRKSQPPLLGVPVPGAGPLPADIMLIGERPGKSEPRSGKIFSGIVGTELSRYLRLANLTRDEVYTTNLVKDYTDFDPTEDEVLRDLPELLQEIEECNPSVLVPMGRFAIRFFLGDVDVDQVHGIAFHGDDYGYPGRIIYPTYHPAAGLHSGDTVPVIHSDFLGLGDWPSRLLPVDTHPLPEYRDRSGRDLFNPTLLMAVDSEGLPIGGGRYRPWSVQLSQRPGVGLIARAGDQIRNLSRDWNYFWSAGGRLVVHSAMHDLSVCEELGLQIRDGQFIDTMVLSYNLTDLPQGLKPLAYRLAGMTMMSYEEVVAPARASVHREWLAAATEVAPDIAAPELELVWDDKKTNWRVKQPQTIEARLQRLHIDLAKQDAGGKPVDISKRVTSWEDSAAEELISICGELTEPSLADVPQETAVNYACRDADATIRIAPILLRRIADEGLTRVMEIDHAVIPMFNRMQANGMLIDQDHFRGLDEEWTDEMSGVRDQIEHMVGVRINPSSPDQVSALLFKQLGLPSKKLTKGGDDSTQDKVLESLRHLHPVLPLIMDYRELDKMRGSFCRKMLVLVGSDGRVRGNIRLTRTASGRPAMNTPNLLAIPVRMARGRRIREGFIAGPGNVIGNWDLDQIEMREITDVSQDPLLLELFRDPKRDIHSETAARMFDKLIADIDPKTERYAAKRVGFGIATQITGRGLVDQMELANARHADGSHWTEDECDGLIELWFGVYPAVRHFIDRTKARCRRYGTSVDRWGRIRHLEGVWSSVGRISEEALRQAPSHEIQAGAQGVMKQNMAAIDAEMKREGLYELGVMPLLQIYDSIMFEYPEELHPIVDDIVMRGMQETVADQYSIPITASGEYGYNWGKMNLGED